MENNHQKEKKKIESAFRTEEEFVKEVEKIFTSLKGHDPFSLEVNMGSYGLELEVDIEWKIALPDGRQWSLSQVESALRVLASRQTPNVRETHLNIGDNNLGDISAEVWRLFPKLNNLSYLDIGLNKLSVVSPLVCDLTHLQHLNLNGNHISAEGVVGVCELLKVC